MKRSKKFDPKDPWPPYPPPEPDPVLPKIDDINWDREAKEAAWDMHGLYDSNMESAFEDGYVQAVQDIRDHLEGES